MLVSGRLSPLKVSSPSVFGGQMAYVKNLYSFSERIWLSRHGILLKHPPVGGLQVLGLRKFPPLGGNEIRGKKSMYKKKLGEHINENRMTI